MNAQVVISRINLPDGMDPATITAQQLNTSDSSYGHNPKVQFKLRKPPPYRNHAQDFVQSVPSNSYTAVNIPNHIPKDVMHAAQAVNAQSASLLTPDLSENFHGTEKSLLSAGRIVPIDHYVPIGANSQSTIPIPRPQTSYFPLQGEMAHR
ncbi:hypothetical protein N7461_004888 [Penicillium sp. DV-2018c]|nr:hypothetical protein N7461_004888 [Penicillium sp. DV-2018c]